MGLEVPQEVKDEVRLLRHLAPTFETFRELSAGRPWLLGMGAASPLPITPRQRLDAAEERGIAVGTEDYDDLVLHLKALDRVWLENYSKRNRPKAGK